MKNPLEMSNQEISDEIAELESIIKNMERSGVPRQLIEGTAYRVGELKRAQDEKVKK